MKYDLHIHSKYSSDGILDPEKIVKIAIERGLNGIAITDHNTIKRGIKAKKYETEDFKVVVGSEIMTERGEITGLFLSEEIEFRTKHNLTIVGGSDAHFLNEIGEGGITTEAEDIREAIMKNDVKVFGKRSSLVNHVGTKVLKLWRKTVRFG